SRRVYELLACGTPVVSAPSKALEEQFSGIVQIANNEKEANATIGKLLSDETFYNRIAHLGYREVMQRHTYRNRLGVLLSTLDLPYTDKTPLVSVVMCTMRPDMIGRIVTNLTRQIHPCLEVIFILQGFSSQDKKRLAAGIKATKSNIGRIEIVSDDSPRTLGERFNNGVSLARGEYIAKMDDDDLYFDHYIADMLIPFSFGDFALVGKKEVFMYLEGSNKLVRRFPDMRHQQTDFVSGSTFVIRRDILNTVPFPSLNRGEDSGFLKNLSDAGHKIYSADPYNYIIWRHSNQARHTWKVEDDEFLKSHHTNIEGAGLNLQPVQV
ncbi:MAG: glycosyltransferase, partial [Sphingomonadales bacterium]